MMHWVPTEMRAGRRRRSPDRLLRGRPALLAPALGVLLLLLAGSVTPGAAQSPAGFDQPPPPKPRSSSPTGIIVAPSALVVAPPVTAPPPPPAPLPAPAQASAARPSSQSVPVELGQPPSNAAVNAILQATGNTDVTATGTNLSTTSVGTENSSCTSVGRIAGGPAC